MSTETDDAGRVLNAWCVRQDFLHIRCYRGRALERSTIRELEVYEGIALIFVRKEARRHAVGKKHSAHAEGHEQHDRDNGLLNEHRAPTDVALGCALKQAVKPIEKPS